MINGSPVAAPLPVEGEPLWVTKRDGFAVYDLILDCGCVWGLTDQKLSLAFHRKRCRSRGLSCSGTLRWPVKLRGKVSP